MEKTKQQIKSYFESEISDFLQVSSAKKYTERVSSSKITTVLVSPACCYLRRNEIKYLRPEVVWPGDMGDADFVLKYLQNTEQAAVWDFSLSDLNAETGIKQPNISQLCTV